MGLLPVTLEKGEPPNLPHATTFSLAALTSASAGQVKEELGLGPGQMGGGEGPEPTPVHHWPRPHCTEARPSDPLG